MNDTFEVPTIEETSYNEVVESIESDFDLAGSSCNCAASDDNPYLDARPVCT